MKKEVACGLRKGDQVLNRVSTVKAFEEGNRPRILKSGKLIMVRKAQLPHRPTYLQAGGVDDLPEFYFSDRLLYAIANLPY